MGRLRRGWTPALLAACGSVLIAGSVDEWGSDQAQYDAFRSSSVCAQGPVRADEDCVTLHSARVLDVQNFKGRTDLTVQGWPELEFDSDPGFVTGLRAGETVEVILWGRTIQGIEYRSDGPDYLSESAVLAPTRDYALMVLGLLLLCVGGLFGAVALLRRRGASRERIRSVQWSLGSAAGLAFLNLLGVILTNSPAGGFVTDGVLGGLTLAVVGMILLAGRRRRPFRVPVPVRTSSVPAGPSANARMRRRPKSRPQSRRSPRSR
jgi:hypothetical protein